MDCTGCQDKRCTKNPDHKPPDTKHADCEHACGEYRGDHIHLPICGANYCEEYDCSLLDYTICQQCDTNKLKDGEERCPACVEVLRMQEEWWQQHKDDPLPF